LTDLSLHEAYAKAESNRHDGVAQDQLNFAAVMQIFFRTWPFIHPSLKHLILFVVISGVVFVYVVGLGFIITGLMNGAIVGAQPLGALHVAIYGLDPDVFVNVEVLSDEARRQLPWLVIWTSALLFVVAVPVGFAMWYYTVWIFQAINQRMRVKLIEQLQMQSLAYHNNSETGDAIYRVYQDSAMVTQIIRSIFLDPLQFLGRYLFAVVVVAAFDPWLALVVGVTLLPVLTLGYWFSSPLRRAFRTARESNSSLTSWIQESIVGIRVVKATGHEQERLQTFVDRSSEAFGAAFRARVMLAILGIFVFVVISIAILTNISIAAMFSNANDATFARNLLLGFGFAVWNLGSFTAFMTRSADGIHSLNSLLAIWGRAQDMAVGLSRVYEILDLTPDIVDAPHAVDLTSFSTGIRFDHVGFEYRTDIPVLRDINFEARPGTITALIGATGTGKSTLMSLLLRLADPSRGRITIDDHDLRDLTLSSLRNQISIATQENILFSETVRENIRYAVPDASDDDVIAAAHVSVADEFIKAMPQQYDTPLGERATRISTGQRQRIVIARAIIKDTPILILDEPTAALDAETELQVMANLARWGKGRCIFLITHRLSTIRRADNVLYLKDGHIAATGVHDELIQTNDAYRTFVQAETGTTDMTEPVE